MDLDEIDLGRRELFRHGFPHDVFTVLRDEAPIFRHPATPGIVELGMGDFVVVSRHADVVALSRDHERFRSFEGPRLAGWEESRRGQVIVTMDPPEHTRVRRLVGSGFTPRRVAQLEDQTRRWAVMIIERAIELGECNFVHDVAYQLPMHMIADIVGIPMSDREHLFEMLNRQLYALDPDSALSAEESQAMAAETALYGRELAAEKRRNPADDVWTTLTTAEVELPDGSRSRLSEKELDLFFVVLSVAGSETTRNAISGGLLALVENPEQLERLRADPALGAGAAEEILRWSSPVAYFRRTAVHDTELHGVPVRAGDAVTLWYPSANRDEAVFSDPFRFDITRQPNPQVSFGGPGIHYCLGANLARHNVRVLFEELLARVGTIEVLGEPVYSVAGILSPVASSLKELPVRLTAA